MATIPRIRKRRTNKQRGGNSKKKPVIKYMLITIDRLNIDGEYQRSIDRERSILESKAKTLKSEAFGVLDVARRPDGSLWVVDGQRRLTMARAAGWTHVPCAIFRSTGKSYEAQTFRIINKERKGLTGVHLLHAQVAAGDNEAKEIIGCLAEYGLELDVSNQATYPKIRSAAYLGRAWRAGVLEDLCWIISQFREDEALVKNKAVSAYTFNAVAEFLIRVRQRHENGASCDYDRFRVLRVLRQEMLTLEDHCPSRGGIGGGRYAYMAAYLGRAYNWRLSKDKKVKLGVI